MRPSTEQLLRRKQLPPPYTDYVAAICRTAALRRHADRLSRIFPALPVSEWTPPDAGPASLAVAIAAPPELQTVASGDSIHFFEGYLFDEQLQAALGHELASFLSHPQRRHDSQLTAARGVFSAGASNGDVFVLIPDPLGMNVVFFGEQDGVTFVSNRYSLMARAFEGCPVDTAHLALSFTRHIKLGDETSLVGVRSLPFGCWLEVTKEGPSVVPGLRRRMEEVTGDAAQYETFLQRGLEEVQSNLAQVTKPALFLLSGGLDSRVVLSGILGGDLKREFLFYTNRTGDEDELIGTRLIDQFALERQTGGKLGGRYAFHFDESELIDWISEFVCEHRTPDASFFPSPAWHPDLSLTGGQGGETFRGFYTPLIAKRKGFDLAALEVNLDDVVRATADANLLTEQGRDILRAQTAASMPDFPHQQLTDVDLLYPLYRNRYHFGFSVRARNLTAPSYIVLYAPSLVLASMCVSERDRARGRVAFDFIARLYPPLLSIPGTYGPWPKEFLDRLGPAFVESQWQPVPRLPQAETAAVSPRAPTGGAEVHDRIVARAWDSLNWLRDSAALSPLLRYDAIERKLKRADGRRDTRFPFLLAVRSAWCRWLTSREGADREGRRGPWPSPPPRS